MTLPTKFLKLTATLCGVCFSGLLCGGGSPASAAPSPETIAAGLTLTDPTVVNGLYKHTDRWHAGEIASDGAASDNIAWEQGVNKRWNIERQRYGADFIQGGTAMHDDGMVDQGVKIIDWGWQQQQSDGAFGKACTGGYHSITMFVEAAARGIILLQAYDSSRYAGVISQDKDHLRRAIDYLRESDVTDKGNAQDDPFTHRRWLAASMYAESAVALGDNSLYKYADAKAQEGLGLQQPDGTNPEKGGFDVTYQSFGMTLAYRYMQASDNADLRTQTQAMIAKGTQLLAGHVGPGGQLDTSDSTRTTHEISGATGKAKGVDFRIVIQILSYAARLTGNSTYSQDAKAVAVSKGWGS